MANEASPLSRRIGVGRRWLGSADAPRWAWRAAVVVAAVVIIVAGRRQWFIRDDWALLLTRPRIRHDTGIAAWLFTPQDGHWLTVPTLLYQAARSLFGLGSYWPFVMLAMATHVGIVALVHLLCRRHGVTAWTATAVGAVLLVFGSGWENILFAVQVSYNLSLLGFLAQLVLTDHDGPLDWRDGAGLACGAIGMMSSGFGPFFIGGIALFLLLRRRWRAAALAAAPLAAGYLAWWIAYGADEVAQRLPGGKSQVPAFVARGFTATFTGLVGFAALAGLALLATLAVVLWRRRGRLQPALVAMAASAVALYGGIGWERVGLGLGFAESSRYVYVAVMLVAPAFALAVDQLARLAPSALAAGRLIVAASVVVNAGSLLSYGTDWAAQSACERDVLELVAASPAAATADPDLRPLQFSPDVRVADLPALVGDGAVVPRRAASPADEAAVAAALAPSSPACARP